MTDFAVLRAPSQVLFGSGMAAAAGDVAAEHGRRVLVITDPVIAQTPGAQSSSLVTDTRAFQSFKSRVVIAIRIGSLIRRFR